MKKWLFCALCFFVLSAHDLFLKTNDYTPAPHSKSELFLFNGTFDKSENIITRKRMIASRVIGPDYRFAPEDTDWYDRDNATFMKYAVKGSGTYVAGVSTLPSLIELSAEDFNGYLKHDGILDMLAYRKKHGQLDQAAHENYSKHVKAILQVSDRRTDHYKEVFGYPVEFVPLQNPYDTRVGETLTVQLLKNGEPLTDHAVYFANRSHHTHTAHSHEGDEDHHHDEQTARTDAQGRFKVTIDHVGVWYLRTINMVESPEEKLDYESNWATLTFEIR